MKLHIAENLRRLRQSKALTQEQLAERLGVSFQFFRKSTPLYAKRRNLLRTSSVKRRMIWS